MWPACTGGLQRSAVQPLDSGNQSGLHCSLPQSLSAPLLRLSVPLKLLSLNPVQDFTTGVIQSVLTFSFHLNCVLRPSWAGIETNAQRKGKIVLYGCPLCWFLKSITLPGRRLRGVQSMYYVQAPYEHSLFFEARAIDIHKS